MSYRNLLLLILAIKALFFIFFIHKGYIGLGPDEAQYWTWSQAPDWGYYSKPPGIAWQIALGTSLFGNTELGMRFGSVIIGFLLPLAVYYLGQTSGFSDKSSFWGAVIMACSPLGMTASLLAITDGGLVLFWTLGCLILVKAINEEREPNYPLFGLMVFFGALFKWPIYLLWIFAFLNKRLRSNKMVLGIAISLLGLLPSFIWNMEHDWATFKHVFFTVKGSQQTDLGTTELAQGNFLDFLGAQIVLVSPIYFGLMVASLFGIAKIKEPSSRFCALTCFSLVGVYLGLSFFQKLQGNWVDYAYPAGFAYTACYAVERIKRHKIWLVSGTALALFLSLASLTIPYIQEHNLFSSLPFPYKANPFKHNMGWKNIPAALENAGYDPDRHFLVSDKYQNTSILSFYSPGQKRAYFLNLQGMRKNQFSYWPDMEKGQDGFFVLFENSPHIEKVDVLKTVAQLKPYFDEVQFVEERPIFLAYGKEGKGMFIFTVKGYNGKKPKDPERY